MTKFKMDGKTYTVRWDKIIGLLVLGAMIGAMLVWGLFIMSEEEQAIPQLPMCPTEDSDNCYWDGGANGEGDQFWVQNGEVHYVNR